MVSLQMNYSRRDCAILKWTYYLHHILAKSFVLKDVLDNKLYHELCVYDVEQYERKCVWGIIKKYLLLRKIIIQTVHLLYILNDTIINVQKKTNI